ncbi:FkbM family methyltransferase [Mucilaginibacter sp.]|uniref:FkbM family methyltransferase n=1 Tax=Mucilaginibacter sp. TaxID=1882438 RepID=UPI00260D349C|nr:FkbM family methyltransferase [Mucilaginibacter sp.]MDB4927004.1 FkbM family methyltransferase [Mucilaginibacter sp.]
MEKLKRTFGFIFSHPLGKKHRLKSLFRFIYWQLQVSLSPDKYFVKTFISPVKFYARKGLTGITGNIYTGLHEFNDMAFLLHLLRPDDTFFDIGANVGSYTLLASGICKATSITIEPIPVTFEILASNIALNHLKNMATLVNAGAGDTKGSLIFSRDNDTTNHVIAATEANKNTIEVPVVIIDELLDAGIPILVKIDVEGFESRVLNGMTTLLANQILKALIIEMSNNQAYGFDDNYAHELLTSNNFTPFAYDPFTRRLTELADKKSDNIIYCRDIDYVKNRIETAQPIHIMGELL